MFFLVPTTKKIFQNIKASTLTKTPLHNLQTVLNTEIENDNEVTKDFNERKLYIRSADSNDNYVDDDDDDVNKVKENKDEMKSSENNEDNNQSPHPHGSHGPLGHVKFLLNHVQQGGGIHALGNTINGAHHHQLMPNTHHESAIETEKDRTTTNTGAGLQVLEFLGTIFGLVWGFLSNIPALFSGSSANASGGRQ